MEIRAVGEEEVSGKFDGIIFHKSKISIEKTLQNLSLNLQAQDKFSKKARSPKVLPSEPGFGRENPFVGW